MPPVRPLSLADLLSDRVSRRVLDCQDADLVLCRFRSKSEQVSGHCNIGTVMEVSNWVKIRLGFGRGGLLVGSY
jgi:hypothetical protein